MHLAFTITRTAITTQNRMLALKRSAEARRTVVKRTSVGAGGGEGSSRATASMGGNRHRTSGVVCAGTASHGTTFDSRNRLPGKVGQKTKTETKTSQNSKSTGKTRSGFVTELVGNSDLHERMCPAKTGGPAELMRDAKMPPPATGGLQLGAQRSGLSKLTHTGTGM